MLNGFVGFQFAEDGTSGSIWFMRVSTLVFWVIGFVISSGTFRGMGSLGPESSKQGGLWFFEIVFPLIMVLIYIVSQVILVLRTLNDLWPLNDITFGVLAFVAGLILMYGFNNQICERVRHYIDGTFFGALCMLFSVMIVYKYWDSITREDLEFSVGSKHAVWDSKEPFMPMDYDNSSINHEGTYARGPVPARSGPGMPPSPPQKHAGAFSLAPPPNRGAPDASPGYPPHH